MAKGGDFEREIAKFLTKWATGQDKTKYFWRTPGSGAMATISEANKNLSGDIHALRPEVCWFTDNWSIECKKGYPSTSIDKILKENKSEDLIQFWKQCCNDAKNANKKPLLIFRKKGFKPWVGILPEHIIISDKLKNLTRIKLHLKNCEDILIFDMENFFNTVTPKDMGYA